MNIEEIRAQYPQYDDMSDDEIARGFHKKHYSDMDYGEFSKKIGVEPDPFATNLIAQDTLAQRRSDISKDATLRFGPWDTGIGIPQWADEGLAGMGREFMELVTAGKHQGTADELLDDSVAATVGSIGADVAAGVLGGGMLGTAAKGLQFAPKVSKAVQWAGNAIGAPKTLSQSAAGGAALGGLLSDGSIQDRAIGAASGATGGLLGTLAPRLVGKAFAPNVMSKAGKALVDQGVEVTPGQLMGGKLGYIEEQIGSNPIMGPMVNDARRHSLETWNRAVNNDALAVIGKSLPDNVPTGRKAYQYMDDVISKQYDDVLDQMPVVIDNDMRAALTTVPDDWDLLETSVQNHWKRAASEVQKLSSRSDVTGNQFKSVESKLRAKAARLQKSQSVADQEAGELLDVLHSQITAVAKKQNPHMAQAFDDVNKAYAKFRTAGDASISSAKDDLFTPAQLRAQIKSRASKKSMFTGRAPGLEELEPAMDSLPNVVPDSGTAGRMMLAALMGGGGSFSPITAPVAGGLLSGMSLYTKPGQNAFRSWAQPTASRKAIGQGIGAFAPVGGLLGRELGVNHNSSSQ